MQEHKNH